MGVVEAELAAFELPGGDKCRVEMNATGVIHLHVGRLRLELSTREFHQLVELVREAQLSLREMKDLDGA